MIRSSLCNLLRIRRSPSKGVHPRYFPVLRGGHQRPYSATAFNSEEGALAHLSSQIHSPSVKAAVPSLAVFRHSRAAMSDDRAFRINGEVIEVDITANPNASLADEDDALTSVELRLEDGHSDLRFWGASSEELTRLCDTLSHARSAVMATTHHGTSKTFATLMAGVRIALKSKSRMVHVPAGGDTISGNSTTHKPRATRPSPSVLIVVPDNERGQCVISLLNEIRSRLRLPLQVGEYLDSGGIQGYEETDDMSVLPCCEMYSRLIDWRPDMSGVRLIVWDEAHRTFGPDLRRLDYPRVYNRWHGSETVHCLKRCHSDTSLLFIGPRELGMSLSIIRDELLGNRGIKRSFMADETADDDRAPHNVGSDRDLPRWRGQIWATFSDLPGELRNRIYGCIMESGVVFELSMFRPAGGHMTCRPMCSSFVQFEVHKPFLFDHILSK